MKTIKVTKDDGKQMTVHIDDAGKCYPLNDHGEETTLYYGADQWAGIVAKMTAAGAKFEEA